MRGFTANLAAGSYYLALTQYDNFSIGNLADGFGEAGNPNFTAGPAFAFGGPCPGNMFRDISGAAGHCRTANWTLDFVNVANATPVAATPEPTRWCWQVPDWRCCSQRAVEGREKRWCWNSP